MKKFRFHWRSAPWTEVGEGMDVADAFRRLGYGGAAINALDYYEEVKEDAPSDRGTDR